jgi:hypothetical protein
MSVQLPPISTVEGVVVRLLLAESRGVAAPSYDEGEVYRGMQAMKAVVDNRLRHHPEQFGAPGALTYVDIITAPGQFQGFFRDESGMVHLSASVQQRIQEVVRLANTDGCGPSSRLVDDAMQVTMARITDPFAGVTRVERIAAKGGSYGWQQEGAADLGGSFLAIPVSHGGIIQGNQFYTLRASFPEDLAEGDAFGETREGVNVGVNPFCRFMHTFDDDAKRVSEADQNSPDHTYCASEASND